MAGTQACVQWIDEWIDEWIFLEREGINDSTISEGQQSIPKKSSFPMFCDQIGS